MVVKTSDVSAVICAHTEDRWDDLAASVRSVQSQTSGPREIIVVIDYNPQLFVRASAHINGVHVIENSQTRGLGGARNSGFAVATGEIVVFLDDDAIADPDWLSSMCVEYTDSSILGVGGAIQSRYVGSRPRWFPEEFAWVVGCDYKGMPETTTPVRNLTGCNMSFRREVLQEIGGFRLGYGCDETELCIRIHQRWPQGTLLYTPRARVRHTVPASRTRWEYFRTRCFYEGGSKAVVTRLVGAQDGLSSERSYTLRTLPKGVLRGLSDAAFKRDTSGLSRAGAIVAGLAMTSAGYINGKVFSEQAARRRGWTA